MPTRKRKNGNRTKTPVAAKPTATLEVEEYIPDLESCEQGRWITHPERPGAEFLIASTSQNPGWDAAMFESIRRIRERCDQASVDPDGTSKKADLIRREEAAKAMAAGLVLKWRGVTRGGKPLPPNLANRTWFCLNARWVVNWAIEQAGLRGNYRHAAMERDSEN